MRVWQSTPGKQACDGLPEDPGPPVPEPASGPARGSLRNSQPRRLSGDLRGLVGAGVQLHLRGRIGGGSCVCSLPPTPQEGPSERRGRRCRVPEGPPT